MKIESSNIAMSGSSVQVREHTIQESLKQWVGNVRPNFENSGAPTPLPLNVKDSLIISDEAREMLKKSLIPVNSVEKQGDEYLELSDEDKIKIRHIEDLIRILTGKKIKIQIPEKIKLEDNKIFLDLKGRQLSATIPQKAGWGLEYEYHEMNYEKQAMSFESFGTVKTSDGREIHFDVDLNVSREFISRQDISIRAGDAVKIDPLVINFDSPTVSLTNNKFSFDIDADGHKDQISFVGKGSGFLSLDVNHDGVINNGSELFGPQSGNGFADLAAYDSDGNMWIDENDDIYDKLRIWTKDENGNDRLFALAEKGVGAIYLGNVSTSFGIKDQNNALQGQIQKTGIFLKESGTAGTIQHVDLAI